MSNASQNFLTGFRLEDAPPPVVHQAKRCLLDLIGVAAAASGLEIARISGLVAGTQFGGAAARLPFDGRRASEAGVALHTAMTIDGFDAHDGHPLTKGHAGCNVLAGLLAFAGDGAGLSGGDALGHLVAGYEIAIRAGIALHATASDYHTSGAWGAVAVAGVGSRVLGLDPVRTREALGIAEYYGPRSQMMRVIDHPTMVKDGSGWGAMVGAVAALLAREGFTGAPAVTVEDEAVAGYWDDLGTRWRMLEQYFKPYPVCAGTMLSTRRRSWHCVCEHSARRACSPSAARRRPTRRSTACRSRSRRCWCTARSDRARSMAPASPTPKCSAFRRSSS